MAVGILCSKLIDADQISQILRNSTELDPYICLSTHDLLQKITAGSIESAVFGVSRFTYEDLDIVNKIRRRLADMPMVILSKKMEDDVASLVETIDYLATLRYPEEIEDLAGVMQKVINKEPHLARRHLRYESDIECQLQWGNQPTIPTSICNISKGGALLYVEGSGFGVGAHVTVTITEDGTSKGKIIPAEVRWIEGSGQEASDPAENPTTLMGVVFLKGF